MFFPLVGSDHTHLPLLYSLLLFSSPTIPKFHIWGKFQGTFGHAEAWPCPCSHTPDWFWLAVLGLGEEAPVA